MFAQMSQYYLLTITISIRRDMVIPSPRNQVATSIQAPNSTAGIRSLGLTAHQSSPTPSDEDGQSMMILDLIIIFATHHRSSTAFLAVIFFFKSFLSLSLSLKAVVMVACR